MAALRQKDTCSRFRAVQSPRHEAQLLRQFLLTVVTGIVRRTLPGLCPRSPDKKKPAIISRSLLLRIKLPGVYQRVARLAIS